jgi:hypothetical protein
MDEESNFLKFVAELEKLSVKYGVAVKSVGGVVTGDLKSIRYSRDWSSGDLLYTAKWNDETDSLSRILDSIEKQAIAKFPQEPLSIEGAVGAVRKYIRMDPDPSYLKGKCLEWVRTTRFASARFVLNEFIKAMASTYKV